MFDLQYYMIFNIKYHEVIDARSSEICVRKYEIARYTFRRFKVSIILRERERRKDAKRNLLYEH